MTKWSAFALAALLLGAACGDDEEKPAGKTCAPEGFRPGLRSDHDAVYVPGLDTVVVFGGDQAPFDPGTMVPSVYTDQLWHYQVGCGAWERVDAGAGPGPRGAYAAALDSKRDRVLLVGGRSGEDRAFRVESDVWSYDPEARSFRELQTGGRAPGARDGHRVVYDPKGDRLILFGGNESATFGNAVVGDTWELSFQDDGEGAWRELEIAGPDPRQDFGMAIDAERGVILLFGGALSIFTFLDDVWALDLATEEWTFVDTAEDDGDPGHPQARFWPEVIAEGAGSFVVFGGHDDASQGNRNDLWRLSLAEIGLEEARWERVKAGDTSVEEPERGSPERRDEHSLVSTPDGILLFGGTTDCGPIDDLWSYSGATWKPIFPATVGETCVRRATADQECEPLSCAAPL